MIHTTISDNIGLIKIKTRNIIGQSEVTLKVVGLIKNQFI